MNYIILTAVAAMTLGAAPFAKADNNKTAESGKIDLSQLDIRKEGKDLLVEMTLDAQKLKLKSNREIVYTPMLVNGSDTLRMRSFSIAGRNRYYSHLRADDNKKEPAAYRAGEIKEPLRYSFTTPYKDWMSTATLAVEKQECGCCAAPGEEETTPVATIDMEPKTFSPGMLYVNPKAEAVKMRSISARAYVDFPVNRTEIYPEYRKNPRELAKIIATIDSVRNDEDLTITSIHIKGFASPEGSYSNNIRLAKGRTATLADYVRNLYHFDSDVITTSYEPEDWQGLIEYVESDAAKVTLTNPEGVLALITDPAYAGRDDDRNDALKMRFPSDYKYLLAEIYPGLRHSDYTVNFNVRTYSDPEEIIEIMGKAPQNLSLNELYVAAKSVEPGSDIYNEAFDIAATMYPEDPVANLNAGCAAIQRGDLQKAAKYLAKAGNSTEADYARAVLAGKEGDYAKAHEMLNRLPESEEREEALRQLKRMEEAAGGNYIPLQKAI